MRAWLTLIGPLVYAGGIPPPTPGVGYLSPDDGKSAERIANFTLLDESGRAFELDGCAHDPETKFVVLYSTIPGCTKTANDLAFRRRLLERFGRAGIWFRRLQPEGPQGGNTFAGATPTDSGTTTVRSDEPSSDSPLLLDDTHAVLRMLGFSHTAQTAMLAPNPWRVVYRGDLSGLLAVLTHSPRSTMTGSLGTTISLRQRHTPAYADDIAPLLRRSCVPCHSEGGGAPFALSNHTAVRRWSGMIREALLAKSMPPWFADPQFGSFLNDPSLSPEETARLIDWIEAGCTNESEFDPLEETVSRMPWPLGEPDAILTTPELKLPKVGPIPYVYHQLESPFEEDTWLYAADINPENPALVHHTIAILRNPDDSPLRWLVEYAPGEVPYRYGEDTGILLRKDDLIELSIHYEPRGKRETDSTSIGLYALEESPPREFLSHPNRFADFLIPAGVRDYRARLVDRFERPVLLHQLLPHMHYRGKWIRYEARYPDGTREPLLSIPRFRFDWQRTYTLIEPKYMPAGTEIHVEAAWDNSTRNPFNPDPSVDVKWGPRSIDEMLYGGVKFSYVGEKGEGNGIPGN